MTVQNTAFIDVEESLSTGMHRAWMREQGAQLIREIQRAVDQGDFQEAYRLVETMDFSPAVNRRMGLLETQATAAYVLGQSFWTSGDVESTLLGGGDEEFPPEITQATQALAMEWSLRGTAEARNAVLALIASEQEAAEEQGSTLDNAGMITRKKAIIPGLGEALNRAVRQNTQVAFAQGANVATSRLASLGALKQAIANGAKRFQRTAVLDVRTCPVCRALHGQVFTITSQVDNLLNLLRIQDTKSLAGAAPFPKQNKAALAQLALMSKEEIVANGWDLPPSHPLCRCILVPVGTVPKSQITGPAGLKIPRARLETTFPETAAESAALDAANALAGAQVKSTEDLYLLSTGEWTKGRQVLHRSIVEDTVEGVVAQEKPIFHMMGGGTASGKSSAVRAGKVKFPSNHAFIDADEIKKALPEFREMIAAKDPIAAAFAHEESSYLAKEIMRAGVRGRYNTVLDGTGDGGFEKLVKKVRQFKDKGYEIRADYVSAELDVAIQRAIARGEKTGRFVPESAIREIHASVSRDFKKAVDSNLFDDVKLWDTSAGGEPRLVFSMKNGKQTIHDQDLWNNFLAKAESTEDLYKLKDGSWIASRQKLHEQIIQDKLEGVVPSGEKTFHMMGGGPASGKSSTIRAGKVNLPKSHVQIDSDDIKGRLPEFKAMVDTKDPRAAAFAHEESSYLAKQTMAAGRAENLDVVLDGTGDGGWASLKKKVDQFRGEGYKIKADYVTVPTDVAVQRAAARGAKTGRVVPESVIRQTHARVSQDFKRAIDEDIFDEVNLWDTAQGGDPVLVFSLKDGKQTIHDADLWQKFLNKANELP